MSVSAKHVSTVLGNEITVVLVDGRRSAAVIVRNPQGDAYHEQIDLPPLLVASLTEEGALEWVAQAVAIGIKGADMPGKD